MKKTAKAKNKSANYKMPSEEEQIKAGNRMAKREAEDFKAFNKLRDLEKVSRKRKPAKSAYKCGGKVKKKK